MSLEACEPPQHFALLAVALASLWVGLPCVQKNPHTRPSNKGGMRALARLGRRSPVCLPFFHRCYVSYAHSPCTPFQSHLLRSLRCSLPIPPPPANICTRRDQDTKSGKLLIFLLPSPTTQLSPFPLSLTLLPALPTHRHPRIVGVYRIQQLPTPSLPPPPRSQPNHATFEARPARLLWETEVAETPAPLLLAPPSDRRPLHLAAICQCVRERRERGSVWGKGRSRGKVREGT